MKLSEYPGLIYSRCRKTVKYVFVFMIIYQVVTSLVLSHFQAEAELALNTISNHQSGHYQGHGFYTDDFSELVVGFDPDFAKYIYFVGPEEYEGRSLEELGLALPIDFAALGAPEPHASDDGFVAVAIGNIDFDDDLDVWVVANNRAPENVQSDVFSFYRLFIGALREIGNGNLANNWLMIVSVMFVVGGICVWVYVDGAK